MIIGTATALPEILDSFNTRYNTTGTRLDTCDTCHIPGQLQNTTNLNPYGMAIKSNLNMDTNQAYKVIEPLDSDGDGFTNIDEIHNLTFPGNKSDFPRTGAVVTQNNKTNRTTDNNDNNVTIVTTIDLKPTTTTTTTTVTVTIPKTTTQKIPGFGIFISILSFFILAKYRNRKK
jgi:hypothetical protein